MSPRYFSDRESGAKQRTLEDIPESVWSAIVAEVSARLADSSFGESFPEQCPDGNAIAGCNAFLFRDALRGQVPGIEWPPAPSSVPNRLDALDFVEFCHDHTAKPIKGGWHGFFQHSHLSFDVEEGRAGFRKKNQQNLRPQRDRV